MNLNIATSDLIAIVALLISFGTFIYTRQFNKEKLQYDTSITKTDIINKYSTRLLLLKKVKSDIERLQSTLNKSDEFYIVLKNLLNTIENTIIIVNKNMENTSTFSENASYIKFQELLQHAIIMENDAELLYYNSLKDFEKIEQVIGMRGKE